MNKNLTGLSSRVCAAALVLSVGLATQARADDIKREGEGARRTALNATELKPFDLGQIAAITEWNTAPSGADLTGKVVVFCMWADWYAPCKRVMVQCQKLAEKYGKDGLVVIAVHNAKGWDAAKNPKFSKDVAFFAGLDAKGEFRKALNSDQDPDVYVVDRAGQMRYADIDKASLEAGVQVLLKETAEQAASINGDLAAAKKKVDEDLRRSQAINQSVDMTSLPELDFTAPSPEAYKRAKWPKIPKDRMGKDLLNPGQAPTTTDTKEEEKPPQSIQLADAQFLGAKPAMNGRVRLIHVWHPDSRFSFENMPYFDLVQRQRGRDVVVVGAVTTVKDMAGKDPEMDPIKIKKRIDEFLATRKFGHAIYFDAGSAVFTAGQGSENGSQPTDGIPNPFVIIVSSDGILRWAGGTWFPSYEAALEQIIREDPGVQARRKVEAEFIKRKGK